MTSTTSVEKIARGEKPESQVAKFSRFLDKMKPQLALALPRHLNADRMSRLALTAFSTTPALQECTPDSIAGCIMIAAQLGLEPGVNGQAYLIPYKDRRNNKTVCTFVPGWKGLVDLVARSGRASVWTGAVFDGDKFEYQLGDSPFCRHTPSTDDVDGSAFTHVYAIGRVKDSQTPVIEVWSRARVQKHLTTYNKVGDRHYAKSGENNFQMYGRKVALLQVLKYMPSSIELTTAAAFAQAADTGENMVLEGDYISVAPTGNVDQDTGEISGSTATPATTYAQYADRITKATDKEIAALVMDEARDLPDDQYQDLRALWQAKFPGA